MSELDDLRKDVVALRGYVNAGFASMEGHLRRQRARDRRAEERVMDNRLTAGRLDASAWPTRVGESVEAEPTAAPLLQRMRRDYAMPAGTLERLSLNTVGQFDASNAVELFFELPGTTYDVYECVILMAFRQFYATATAASAGGSSTETSGASSNTSSGSNAQASSDSTSGSNAAASSKNTADAAGGASNDETTSSNGGDHRHPYVAPNAYTGYADDGGHTHALAHHHTHDHGMAHTHSHSHNMDHTHSHSHNIGHNHDVTISNHSHGLTYGIFKESMPASWSVKLRLYERVGSTWTLRHTSAAITTMTGEVDITDYVTGAGMWKVELQSDAGQPNGGRLSAQLYGHVVGAVRAA